MRRGVRPTRPFSPIAGAVVVLGGWYLIAHNSGDGWVQAIGVAMFAILAAGIIGPAVFLARTRIRCSGGQLDGSAGRPLTLLVDTGSRVRVRPVEPAGPESFVGPLGVGRKARRRPPDALTLEPSRRGVFHTVVVDVATAAPFGLQWWNRRITLVLPAALHVAPRPARAAPPDHRDDDTDGSSSRLVPDHAGDPAGVRPYKPGDPRSHVHWPATAHNRDLMVKEMEVPAAHGVRVTVRLPADPDRAERIAETAMGTVSKLIEDGVPVLLATSETAGDVTAIVEHRLGAGRRLARAVPSPSAGPTAADDSGVTVQPWG